MKRLIPLAAAAALLATAPAADAAVGLSGGSTQVTLNKGTAQALSSLGVSVTPTGRARANGTRVTFPITGGSIDPATAAGTIRHRGGLRFRGHGKSITLKDYNVSVGNRIRLSARVGNARVTILNLTGTPKVTRAGFNTNVSGLTAELTTAAAKALNATFGVHAFRKGIKLGRVKVGGPVRRHRAPGHGPDRARDRSRDAAGAHQPRHRARRDRAGDADRGDGHRELPDHRRPGEARPQQRRDPPLRRHLADQGRHGGGADRLRHPPRQRAAAVRLAQRRGHKVAIIDLDLTGVTPAVSGRAITLDGVTAKLTQGAADALNGAFATTAFTAGLVLGKAKVEATGK